MLFLDGIDLKHLMRSSDIGQAIDWMLCQFNSRILRSIIQLSWIGSELAPLIRLLWWRIVMFGFRTPFLGFSCFVGLWGLGVEVGFFSCPCMVLLVLGSGWFLSSWFLFSSLDYVLSKKTPEPSKYIANKNYSLNTLSKSREVTTIPTMVFSFQGCNTKRTIHLN